MKDKKTRGILFYHNYDITDQLSVALYSLRKYYDDAIHVTLGPSVPDPLVQLFNNQDDVSFNKIDAYYYTDFPRRGFNTRRKEWCQKPFIIRDSPFDLTLYYDCDHIFFRKFDMSIFDEIDKHELITPVPCAQPRRSRNIKSEFRQIGIEFDTVQRFNGGCIGLKKDTKLLEKVVEKIPVLMDAPGRILRRNPEEFSFSFTINSGYGSIVDPKWSSNYGSKPSKEENNIAIHYSMGRFKRDPRWFELLEKVKEENYLGFSDYWKTPEVTPR